MKFENLLKKISAIAAAFIVYFLCAGFYLSLKGFVMQPNGEIVLIKEAHASSDIDSLATTVNNKIALTLPDGPVMGADDAPVTVYEFSSLNCGHCSEFHLSTLPLLKQEFIDSGHVKFIFTNFPLDKKSMKAAMLAECVPASHHASFITTLFKKQREWMLARNTEEVLLRYAMLNGLTETQGRECLSNDNLAKDILEIRQQGLDRLNIKGTPAFLVVKGDEREILYGAPAYRTFKTYLQSKIAL